MSAVVSPLSRLRNFRRLLLNAHYDAMRFWRASFTNGGNSRENLRARITMDGHYLEYGLSLRGAEAGHGQDRARRLVADIADMIARFGADATTEIGMRALRFWIEKNQEAGADVSEFASAALLHPELEESELRGGVDEVTGAQIRERGMIDFIRFAESRYSVRDYSAEPVPVESLLRAVRVAQKSPSSCNRQTCHVHIWTDPELRKRVLSLQQGNTGFGHLLGGIAVVTSQLENWEQASERYQGWIDGGMFAMSFVYALHAEGLGAITLNWSQEKERDRQLRKLLNLGDNELVVTMIGFGSLPEHFSVPVAERRPLEMAYDLNRPLTEA